MWVELGSTDDLGAFVDRLEEAAAWLWSRGVEQWRPGSIRAEAAELRSRVERGALVCLREESGALHGGCLVDPEPDAVWAGRPGEAAYLSRLVVSRHVAGQEWGARLVEHSERWAAEAGYARLRLDCWAGNAVLAEYYRGLGFSAVGTVGVEDYRVRLFEKVVGRDP